MHVPSWGGTRSVNIVSTLKETFKEEILYFCLRTCKIYQVEGSQITGDDRARVKLKLGEDRMHALSLKREREGNKHNIYGPPNPWLWDEWKIRLVADAILQTIDICQKNAELHEPQEKCPWP